MNQLINHRIILSVQWHPLISQTRGYVVNVQRLGAEIRFSKRILSPGERNLFVVSIHSAKEYFATETKRRAIPKKFKKALLPFEMETNAVNDILLFSYHQKERLCKAVSFGGLFLFCVLLNSSELTYRTLGTLKTAPPNEDFPWYHWWRYINFDSKIVKYGASGFIGCFAFVVLAFAMAYPTRMVREITLLRGGEKILIQTYRPFGLVKSVELPLKDISAQRGPTEATEYLPIKLKGKKVPLLVNQDGHYHNKALFDQTVGLYRF